jgi:molybdenum cofactor cytidylyltransferase
MGTEDQKVSGLDPEAVDALLLGTSADYIIVEADGARSLSVKAPADHEPVIPSLSTTVVVVMGADALESPLNTVAHRIERISALTGLTGDDVLTPQDAATILLHPEGGLKDVPGPARVVTIITKVTPENVAAANTLAAIVKRHPRIDRALMEFVTG